MPDLKNEISRTLPGDTPDERDYPQGTPIMYGFDCALCEKWSGTGFVYTAVNYENGRSQVVARRKNAFELKHELKMAELLRDSRVAGVSRFLINRPVGQSLPMQRAKEILRYIFRSILPLYGYSVRDGQIELAEHILGELTSGRGEKALVEAGTGFGKSEAYLIPLIIVKLGRMNERHNLSLYPEMQYADMPKLPVIVSTASIALQKAITREYIPKLSRMLLDNGLITAPVTCVLRKGREHYVCKRNMLYHLTFVNDANLRRELERLLLPGSTIDLAEVGAGTKGADLPPRLKRQIFVPVRCADSCKYRSTCQFLAFREQVGGFQFDIQVTNHQLLIADTINRANGRTSLLPNYQAVCLDEAHLFTGAARSLYGAELSDQAAKQAITLVSGHKFKREGVRKSAMKSAKKVRDTSIKLFDALRANLKPQSEPDDDHLPVTVDNEAARQLGNMRDAAEKVIIALRDELFGIKTDSVMTWVRERYKTQVSVIDLNRLFTEHADVAANREEQNKLHHLQAVRLHQAICRLPGVAACVERERENRREPRFGINPERYVLQQERSSVKDTIWRQIENVMLADSGRCKGCDAVLALIWDLSQLLSKTANLADSGANIYWLEREDGETTLCATPKNLPDRLYADQWRKSIPHIFTSGTLSANSDFTRTKRTLGLNKTSRVSGISKQSPYNYRDNCLLYLPENLPFPDPQSERYITAIADETERLIRASNGHAAVLFTSYYVMGVVHKKLKERGLPYELLRMERGTSNAIARFKNCKAETGRQGVLLASGALWEGIDIAGDALSMLIIVKLPFPIPDAIAEYEQSLYPNFDDYRDAVLLPEMLIKLKQGFGRLIRTETDSGVVAILDNRANSRGSYRECALNALPDCRVTSDINKVNPFLTAVKPLEYWD